MQRNIKLAIAAVILIAGFSAALMFRRSPSATADSETTPSESLPYRAATPAAPAAVTFPAEAAATAKPAAAAAATATPVTAAATSATPPAKPSAVPPWSTPLAGSPLGGPATAPSNGGPYGEVPSLPTHYGPPAASAPPALPAPPPAASPPSVRIVPTAPPEGSPAAAATPLGSEVASLQAPLRTHRIVDGDTLKRIAANYLGDAGRAAEILKLNREILDGNGDLLPIGVVLKIPPTDPAGSHRPGSASDAAGDLVPIPKGALRQPVQTVVPRQLEPAPAVHP